MVHGDDKGLRLPPNIAPVQVVIIPIYKSDADYKKIKKYAQPIIDGCVDKNISYYLDERETVSPGFKFNEWEMKGVPLRIEIGMRDIANKEIVMVRRDTSKKSSYKYNEIIPEIVANLKSIQSNLFQQASNFRDENSYTTNNYDEFKNIVNNQGGFIRCYWDGTSKTEALIKKETNTTIRCILNEVDKADKKCIYSQLPAKFEVIFSKAY